MLRLEYSIRKSDYNRFPMLLLMPFYFIFGESRLRYILAITNTFFMSCVLILTFLSEKVISVYRGKISISVFFIFMTLLHF